MPDSFKSLRPSDVHLFADAPLTATLGHAEMDHAALLIIRALQVKGDTWRAIKPTEIIEVMEADFAAKIEPLYSLGRNPFFKPSPRELVEKGFATLVVPGDLQSGIALTEAAIDRILVRWRKSQKGEVAGG